MASGKSISVLKGIISELRFIHQKQDVQVKETPAFRYIMEQYRKYNVTDQKLCRGRQELNYLAQTYLSYLSNTRKHKELYAEYHGKGERSVEETANLVGLRLPKLYDDGTENKK